MGLVISHRALEQPDGGQSHSRFMNLPLTVVLLFADHLPAESVAALSLTCKALWRVSYWVKTTNDPGTRPGLLPLLARDRPGIFYCHRSQRLHRIDPNMRPGDGRYGGDWGCCNVHNPPQVDNDRLIFFYHAHLVMNAHRYGPLRGLPLDILTLRTPLHFSVSQGPGRLKLAVVADREARIIDGRLFVRRTLHIGLPEVHETDGRNIMHSIQGMLDICQHQDFPPGWASCILRPNRASGSETYTASCPYCLSEGELVVKSKEGRPGRSVVARSYQQLGRCEAPTGWEWASHATDNSNYRPAEYLPVDVRRRWNSGRIEDTAAKQG